MRWPWVTRKVHELELSVVERRATEAEQREAYWRVRCERLTDAALSRAGAIHEPTMTDRKVDKPNDIGASVAKALSMKEYDSTEPAAGSFSG